MLSTHRSSVLVVVSACCVLLGVSACTGIPRDPGMQAASTGTAVAGRSSPVIYISGTVQSVDPVGHSAFLLISGQQITINGLTDEQINYLRSSQGSVLTVQANQTASNTYTIATGSTMMLGASPTPVLVAGPGNGPATSVSGTIEFVGSVLNANNNNITVRMPDNQGLQMSMLNGQTDIEDFQGRQPAVGQMVKVKAMTMPDGTFQAASLDIANTDDLQRLNVVEYKGAFSGIAGSNNQFSIHIGNRNFTFPVGAGINLNDLHLNMQPSGSNLFMKIEVAFNGASGSIVQIEPDEG